MSESRNEAPERGKEGLRVYRAWAGERRSIRQFSAAPLPGGVLEDLLDCARWAPSGYNLQPAHFIVVDDPGVKARLMEACMDQRQVAEAPVTVVFCGDARVHRHNFERMVSMEKEGGSMAPAYEEKMRRIIPLAFNRDPANWLWKALLPPFLRPFKPIPQLPAVSMRTWLGKQVALGVMNFLMAAHAAGLAAVPMEGFDERRVRRTLRLPRHIIPVIAVSVGYDDTDGKRRKTRLPLESMTHRNGWQGAPRPEKG